MYFLTNDEEQIYAIKDLTINQVLVSVPEILPNDCI